MIVKHSRDIIVDILPKIIRYHIPLILPTEQEIWKASQLVLEVVPSEEKIPVVIDFDKLAQYVNEEKSLRIELR